MKSIPRTFTTSDGLNLVADSWGNPEHPAVIFSHGGGQTRHSWGGTAQALAEQGWYSLTYDHRGHGDSAWSEDADYALNRAKRHVKLGELEESVSELDKLKGQAAFTVRDWKSAAMDRIAVEKALKVIKMECALLNKNMSG